MVLLLLCVCAIGQSLSIAFTFFDKVSESVSPRSYEVEAGVDEELVDISPTHTQDYPFHCIFCGRHDAFVCVCVCVCGCVVVHLLFGFLSLHPPPDSAGGGSSSPIPD